MKECGTGLSVSEKYYFESQSYGFESQKYGFESQKYGFESQKYSFESQNDCFESQIYGFESQIYGFESQNTLTSQVLRTDSLSARPISNSIGSYISSFSKSRGMKMSMDGTLPFNGYSRHGNDSRGMDASP